jgi:ParB/RepB/Spo0J family partition protein
MQGASIARKISLDDIIDTGNVRENYEGIEDLAASIKKNGQLQPVIVKVAEPDPDTGAPRFELIAGFRRREAFRYLKAHGDDYSMINAMIVTGDKLTIQLVENIQRSDLSPKERERGIFLMTQNGLSQKEVAAELSKSEVWVSRHISAYKVRQIGEADGIDTAEVETSAISEIQTVKEEHIPMMLRNIINNGGTVAAARTLMKAYRGNKPAQPEAPPPVTITAPASLAADTAEGVAAILGGESMSLTDSPPDISPELPPEGKAGADNPPPPAATEKPPLRFPAPPARSPDPDRPPVLHKKVDVNSVFDEIYKFISALEKQIKALGPDVDEARIDEVKRQTAWDIIALVQKRIDKE